MINKEKDNKEEWLIKCLTCQHCYQRLDDDYIYCRKRNGKCEYKKYKKKNSKAVRKEQQQ